MVQSTNFKKLWLVMLHTSGGTQFTSNPNVYFRAQDTTRIQICIGDLNLIFANTHRTQSHFPANDVRRIAAFDEELLKNGKIRI